MPSLIDQAWIVPIFILVFLVIVSVKVLREYERGVVFLLGRFWKVKGPGLILIFPVIQQMVRIDLRTRVLDVPGSTPSSTTGSSARTTR